MENTLPRPTSKPAPRAPVVFTIAYTNDPRVAAASLSLDQMHQLITDLEDSGIPCEIIAG